MNEREQKTETQCTLERIQVGNGVRGREIEQRERKKESSCRRDETGGSNVDKCTSFTSALNYQCGRQSGQLYLASMKHSHRMDFKLISE